MDEPFPMNTDTTTPTTIRESVLVQRLNIPRNQMKVWREQGDLIEQEHWERDGNAFVITTAGEDKIMDLLHLPTEEKPVLPAKVPMRAVCAGVMSRVLRCRRVDSNENASVRLTGSRVFAAQFVRGVIIEAVPTETPGIYEYDGVAPRRTRL